MTVREISMQQVDWEAPTISEQGLYRCLWCGWWSPKDEWGPGRCVCPRCRTLAPRAHEWHSALKHRFVDGKWFAPGSDAPRQES